MKTPALLLVSLLLLTACTQIPHVNSNMENNQPLISEFPSISLKIMDKQGAEMVKNRHELAEEGIAIVAFIPTLKNEYANIMVSALDHYFARYQTFEEKYSERTRHLKNDPNVTYINENFIDDFMKTPSHKITLLIITNDTPEAIKNYISEQKISKNVFFASDSDKALQREFKVTLSDQKNSDAIIMLFASKNQNHKLVYFDKTYRGQGERLRLLEAEVEKTLGLSLFLNTGFTSDQKNVAEAPLKVGDKARDFVFHAIEGIRDPEKAIGEAHSLSGYEGKKSVLLAFYPAPYSFSCSGQIIFLEKTAEGQNPYLQSLGNVKDREINLEILMVSASPESLLWDWKDDLDIEKVKLVSDLSSEIAIKYNSLNPEGYNKRTIFLIDKEGIITYIDYDYVVGNKADEEALHKSIAQLK